jgi:hypothetical protein
MSKSACFAFLASLGLGFQACSSGPIDRKDSRVDLARYHTYRWVSADEAAVLHLRDPNVDGPISEPARVVTRPKLEARLRPLVEEQLKEAGYAPDRSGLPDFYVTFYGKSRNEDWVSSWSGTTPAIQHVPLVIFPDYAVDSARTYRDGVVYLTFYDRATGRPAWTGSIDRSRYGNLDDDATLKAEVTDLVHAFE